MLHLYLSKVSKRIAYLSQSAAQAYETLPKPDIRPASSLRGVIQMLTAALEWQYRSLLAQPVCVSQEA